MAWATQCALSTCSWAAQTLVDTETPALLRQFMRWHRAGRNPIRPRPVADLLATDSGLEESAAGHSCFFGLGCLNAFGRRRRAVGHCRLLSVAIRSKMMASGSLSSARSTAGSILSVPGGDERSALIDAIFTQLAAPGSHGLQPNVYVARRLLAPTFGFQQVGSLQGAVSFIAPGSTTKLLAYYARSFCRTMIP